MIFILDNVAGIQNKPCRNIPSPLDNLLAILKDRLKEHWLISATRVNSANYGLPQNRERVYIIGRRANLYQLHGPLDPPFFQAGQAP